MSSPSHKSASRINARWATRATDFNTESYSDLMAYVAAQGDPIGLTGPIYIKSLPLLTPIQSAD